jgi:hypothetical protein
VTVIVSFVPFCFSVYVVVTSILSLHLCPAYRNAGSLYTLDTCLGPLFRVPTGALIHLTSHNHCLFLAYLTSLSVYYAIIFVTSNERMIIENAEGSGRSLI